MNFNPLKEAGRRDFHPKEGIEESLRGVSFDYFYTGKREGPSGQIELHITCVVTDWQENVFVRKAWFMGHKGNWKEVIRSFIIRHLEDLGTGNLLIKRMMQEFEVSQEKFMSWEKYNPECFDVWD